MIGAGVSGARIEVDGGAERGGGREERLRAGAGEAPRSAATVSLPYRNCLWCPGLILMRLLPGDTMATAGGLRSIPLAPSRARAKGGG